MALATDPSVPTVLHPRAFSPAELPAHPSIENPPHRSVNRPSLAHFLRCVLSEGHLLACQIDEDDFLRGPPYSFADVDARIQVYKRHMKPDHKPLRPDETIPFPEHWYGRQSVHENRATAGSVSYAEFKCRLKNQYLETKQECFPGVEVKKLFSYDCSGLQFERFRDISATVYVLTQKHKLARPRTYVSLIVTAAIPLGADPLGPLQDQEPNDTLRRVPNPPQINYNTSPPTVTYDEVGPTTSPDDVLTDDNEPGFLVLQIPLHPKGIKDVDTYISDRAVLVPFTSVNFIRRMTSPDDGVQNLGKLQWLSAMSARSTGVVPLRLLSNSVFPGTTSRRVATEVRRFVKYVTERRNMGANLIPIK
ncbi:hypothetical protein VTO42DRAFT_3779 [Malbranchea cinnamomea]